MFTIEKTCVITKYTEESSDLNIPEYIDDCRVVGVTKGLFEGRKFNNVTLPISLTNMEDAFMTTEIQGKLILNSPVISANAFWMSIIASELVLPECLVSIGFAAFFGSTFTGKLVIPKNVRIIEEGAFMKCCGLTSIEFAVGSKLQSIAQYAFAGCENLRCKVQFPEFLREIGDRAFFDTDVEAVLNPETRVHKGAFKKL